MALRGRPCACPVEDMEDHRVGRLGAVVEPPDAHAEELPGSLIEEAGARGISTPAGEMAEGTSRSGPGKRRHLRGQFQCLPHRLPDGSVTPQHCDTRLR